MGGRGARGWGVLYFHHMNTHFASTNQKCDQPVTVAMAGGGVSTDLQGAVEEAAVLSRLIAQAFAGGDGGHGPGRGQPLHARRAAAGRKVVPLPRHHCPCCHGNVGRPGDGR